MKPLVFVFSIALLLVSRSVEAQQLIRDRGLFAAGEMYGTCKIFALQTHFSERTDRGGDEFFGRFWEDQAAKWPLTEGGKSLVEYAQLCKAFLDVYVHEWEVPEEKQKEESSK
jgi:hypothetical protein